MQRIPTLMQAKPGIYGTSTNTVVAVIDTGIDYHHVDLASNIWIKTPMKLRATALTTMAMVMSMIPRLEFCGETITTRWMTMVMGLMWRDDRGGRQLRRRYCWCGLGDQDDGTQVSRREWFWGLERCNRRYRLCTSHGAKVINASWGSGSFSQLFNPHYAVPRFWWDLCGS